MQIDDLQLQPILNETDSPTIVHGTSMRAWERIKQEGLSRMRRNHIHFAQGEPGESGFVRGLKQSSEILIYLDIPKVLQDGLLLFKSHNGVVLCPGDLNGLISPRYFKAVFQRSPRQQLEFDAQTDGDSNHGDTGEKPTDKHTTRKRRKPTLASGKDESAETYCICKKPYVGDCMIQCDLCQEWFHGKCVNVSLHEAEHMDTYACPLCTPSAVPPATASAGGSQEGPLRCSKRLKKVCSIFSDVQRRDRTMSAQGGVNVLHRHVYYRGTWSSILSDPDNRV